MTLTLVNILVTTAAPLVVGCICCIFYAWGFRDGSIDHHNQCIKDRACFYDAHKTWT